MGTKRDSRNQKKRQKAKVKSAERKRSRSARVDRERVQRDVSMDEVLEWPLGDAFLSQDWHEQGPRVTAVFTRQHYGGTVAAMVFDVDLREQGVVSMEALLGVPEGELHMQLAQRSQQKALMVVDPGLVVKVVREGRAHGEKGGFPQAEGLDAAQAFFGDVRPSVQEVLVGAEPPPPPPAEGLFASLKRRFGMGGDEG
ncbi:MAG: hypothetical protein H6740_06070 [Alphaproteobacteria bacterium]|nr:hypothetical protein [Alphaproteobacteria bacterium]